MPGSMLILTRLGIIFVNILHLATAWCKLLTNIMPTRVKISIDPGIRKLFLNQSLGKSFQKINAKMFANTIVPLL